VFVEGKCRVAALFDRFAQWLQWTKKSKATKLRARVEVENASKRSKAIFVDAALWWPNQRSCSKWLQTDLVIYDGRPLRIGDDAL
jgi:hypothetical protein